MCDALKPNETNLERLELHVTLDAKAIAHLAMLVKDYRFNFHRVTAENSKLRRRLNAMEEKILKAF